MAITKDYIGLAGQYLEANDESRFYGLANALLAYEKVSEIDLMFSADAYKANPKGFVALACETVKRLSRKKDYGGALRRCQAMLDAIPIQNADDYKSVFSALMDSAEKALGERGQLEVVMDELDKQAALIQDEAVSRRVMDAHKKYVDQGDKNDIPRRTLGFAKAAVEFAQRTKDVVAIVEIGLQLDDMFDRVKAIKESIGHTNASVLDEISTTREKLCGPRPKVDKKLVS